MTKTNNPPAQENHETAIVSPSVAVSESVVCAELEQEAVLLNVETGVYFGLDAVGLDIWRMLEEGLSTSQVLERLLQEYQVDSSQAKVDLDSYLQLLLENGLVRLN